MDNAGYVAAGYLLTAAVLGGYVLRLVSRARRARRVTEAVVARRDAVAGGG